MTRKEIAKDFLSLAASGRATEAFGKYVSPGFIHHNAYFKGDGETLMLAMDENAREFPDKSFKMLRALEDGNLVAVHSFLRMEPGDKGMAAMHIFRFEDSMIAEMWDFAQPVPEVVVNENGMF